MGQPENPAPKSPTSHLHVMNLIVALLAGVISITGGIYSLKNNVFSGPAHGSLEGIVRDKRIAKPLKLASVEIADLAGAVVNTATTDDGGNYLIEALKAGNYVVKFTAPLHKVETKTIKIEKDQLVSISVDLTPEIQQVNPTPVESVMPVQQNIRAPYTPAAAYPAAAPVMPGYQASQNTVPVSAVPSTYSQTGTVPDPAFSGPPQTGFRRHSRHSYSGDPAAAASGASQSTSQGDVLAQAGTQLLQALISKKSDSSSTTTSSTSSN